MWLIKYANGVRFSDIASRDGVDCQAVSKFLKQLPDYWMFNQRHLISRAHKLERQEKA